MAGNRHWSEVYPHDLFASVLLLDGKIENWKVGNLPKKTPGQFSGRWKHDRLGDYTAETQKWIVSNVQEHHDVFAIHAPEWFQQWQHADDYVGFPAYLRSMKAITIWQPWATLIALREKRFETRGWATTHRGELAIHAAQKIDLVACEIEPIKSVLAEHGFTADNLPTGVIIAVCELKDCWGIERTEYGGVHFISPSSTRTLTWAGYLPGSHEYCFGNYESGRFAWELTNVRMLQEPIPAKGQQRLWTWKGANI